MKIDNILKNIYDFNTTNCYIEKAVVNYDMYNNNYHIILKIYCLEYTLQEIFSYFLTFKNKFDNIDTFNSDIYGYYFVSFCINDNNIDFNNIKNIYENLLSFNDRYRNSNTVSYFCARFNMLPNIKNF